MAGRPRRRPSPWIPEKISAIFSVGCGGILGFPDCDRPDGKGGLEVFVESPGQVFRRGIERKGFIEQGVIGKDLGQLLLDEREIDPQSGRVKLGDGDFDFDLERVTVDLFALPLVLSEEMGGRETVADFQYPAHLRPPLPILTASGSAVHS